MVAHQTRAEKKSLWHDNGDNSGWSGGNAVSKFKILREKCYFSVGIRADHDVDPVTGLSYFSFKSTTINVPEK